MREVVSGEQNVVKLLGKQKPKDVKYRLMRYVLKAECNDGTLLHNVITGQLVLLDSQEAELLNLLPSKRDWPMTELIENSFLVPEDYDEKAVVHKLRTLMKRLFAPKGINNYLILTTTNCNARCPYCFENGVRLMNMTSSTAEKVIEYIVSHKSKQEIELHWFGGEPLVGVERIDQICEGLKNREVGFKSVMTSNGFLFSEERVKWASEKWNLKMVQITLDGTEAVYNRVKGYVSTEKSPYRIVMRNVDLLLEAGIHVILRLNLDEQNGDDLRRLVDQLDSRFPEKERLSVYVSKIDAVRPDVEEKKLEGTLAALNDYIDERGMSKRDPVLLSLKTNSCMADSDEAVVIYPDGRLGKCETIRDDEVFGHIDSDTANGKTELYKEVFEYSYCRDCPIYPSCILLRRCPTKQREQYQMCQRSIKKYQEDMIARYLLSDASGGNNHSNNFVNAL